MTTVPIRIGRNLTSLEYTSDPTDRATRLTPVSATLGGRNTYLGYARWKVTNNASGVLTLADPAGGAGPVAFASQFNAVSTWYLYRESTAQIYTITASSASPCTVTIASDPGIAVGEYVEFRTTSTAGTAIAVGPGGALSSLSRGYTLPLLATALATNTLTIAKTAGTSQLPATDGQYVGDDVAFSNFVQASVGSGTGTYPDLTVVLDTGAGASASGLTVGDWCISGTLAVWENGSGQSISLPPMTVTAVTTATETVELTIRGTGPTFAIGANAVPLNFFRPVASNLTGTITASSASGPTVTVDSAASLTATTGAPCALELSYTPHVGEVPYYLDHPTYAVTTGSGIGVKFGTIDRSTMVGVANLASDGFALTTTGYTGSTGVTIATSTNVLYTELGGTSLQITPASNSNWTVKTPATDWRPSYTGQRVSVRSHLIIPDQWSGNLVLQMQLGATLTDGSSKVWGLPDTVCRIVPPDSTDASTNTTKIAAGQFFDMVINGLDITAAQGLGFGQMTAADVPNVTGLFLQFTGSTSGVPVFYLDGYSITVSEVAPDAVSQYGDANTLWQDTNRALGLLAPPQISAAVDVVDLGRLQSVSADQFVIAGDVLINDTELGVVNETWRVVEVTKNELVPGDTRVTLNSRLKRFTDFFTHRGTFPSGTSKASGSTGSTTASSGGSSTTGGTGSSGPGGATAPSGTLGLTLDTSNVPTATYVPNASVVRVKIAGRTDRYPTAAEADAEASISPAPFSRTFAGLLSGQTEWCTAIGYDDAGNPSAPAQASATAGASLLPSGMAFHYDPANATDSGGTVTAAIDDSGNGRDLTTIHGTPTLVANIVNGRPVFRFDGASGIVQDPFDPVLNAPGGGVTTFVVCAQNGSGLTQRCAFSLTNSVDFGQNIGLGSTVNVIGGVIQTVGWANTTSALSASGTFDVLMLVHDSAAGTRTYYQNGVACSPTFGSGDSNPAASYSIGLGQRISTEIDYWLGDVAEAGGWYRTLTADEIADLTTALQQKFALTGGGSVITLDYAFSGGDVIVTASMRFADEMYIDGSTSATPSDATVEATTALTTRPFQKTFAAPAAGETLHIKAIGHIDVLASYSTPATVDIPSAEGTFGGSGADTITIPVITTNPDGSFAGVTETAVNVAPLDAEYLVAASSAGLSAERVVTDTGTVSWDLATTGQAKAGVVAGSIGATELAATGVGAATYGDATHVPQITVAADGRITAASNVAVSGGSGASLVGATFDGQGAALTLTGTTKVRAFVKATGTISLAVAVLDQSGSITVGIKKCARASYPGSLTDITGGNDVVVSSAASLEDSTLTGWTTSVTADDLFEFQLKAVDGTVQQATVILEIS